MSDTVIKIENLGKKYKLGQRGASYATLRDSLAGILHSPKRKTQNPKPAPSETELWALKDIYLEIKRGEVVGVIGRNGAGKSTLLKILSRITEPTTGRVELNGRVGSLLEVGTGFHPELTGRENIFLNGSIIGMRKKEVEAKFDEIVAFSEIEKFIDTPVKHYSSGMYVRLAFAVAAHLEPEILLVDEVLAVGDINFQKKCLGKMKDVAGQGRTIIFVSHNMGLLSELTNKIAYLEEGKLVLYGDTEKGIQRYLGVRKEMTMWQNESLNKKDFDICTASICNENLEQQNVFFNDNKVYIRVDVVSGLKTCPNLGVTLRNGSGHAIFRTENVDTINDIDLEGNYTYILELPEKLFNAGDYFIDFIAYFPGKSILFYYQQVLSFTIAGCVGIATRHTGKREGDLLLKLNWNFL